MAGDATGEEARDTPLSRGKDATQSVARFKGRAFEVVCGLATVFGITVVAGLLLYVAQDAFQLGTADRAWHLVFIATLVAPVITLLGYYALRDRAGFQVGYTTLGVPMVGVLVGGGLVVLLREIISPRGLLGLEASILLGVGAVIVHQRVRSEAALERLVVVIAAPLIALFGIPALSVDRTVSTPLTGTELFSITFSLPELLPSVTDVLFAIGLWPADWVLILGGVALPAALLVGRVVAARREDGRGVREAVGASLVLGLLAVVTAPAVDVAASDGVVLVAFVVLPTGAYLEGVLRRREGLSGLLFPLMVVGGLVAGVLLTDLLGFAGPDPWLDWSFMISAHNRTPTDAGIYPALVGSVLIVLVIAASAFPIGVGAAIYLEEYAPNKGRLGRIVELIEINIGNLAGVPSIVYGLLGLALFIKGIGLRAGIVIVGGMTIGLLILPIVIISAQESLRAVPDSLRDASYGMGATRWQTVRTVVLPEALPGILTGTILALGRAIGETAPLLMIGIASSVRTTPDGLLSKTGAMPRQIFSWSSEIEPEFRFGVLAAGVVVLLVVLLLMNGTAILLRNRYQRRT
jgi:phosphate transport system permease protein